MEEIVLDHSSLIRIGEEDLKPFPNLQSLYIPNNKLIELSNLEHNIRIKFIDARNNKISRISIPKQVFLIELYLSNNQLISLDVFLENMGHLKNLEVLDLRDNKLTQEKGYRNQVIKAFPSLKVLDGIEIRKSDRNNVEVQRSVPKNRSASVLEYLKAKQVSNSEKIIQKRAKEIIAERETQNVAQQMQSQMWSAVSPTKNSSIKKPRAKSRMYIKATTFVESKSPTEENLILLSLNPNLPRSKNHVVRENIVYPN